MKTKSPESSLQDRPNAFAWLVMNAVAIYSTVSHWLRFKRICKWYHPPIRMGGNPFAGKSTHGMCKECAAKWQAEVESYKF